MGRGTGKARTPKVRRLRLTPEAELDLADAHAWYRAQNRRVAGEFIAAVGVALVAIRREPEAHPLIDATTRRALLRKFPYCLFYKVSRSEIIVHAVFHGARDPRAWQRRRTDS